MINFEDINIPSHPFDEIRRALVAGEMQIPFSPAWSPGQDSEHVDEEEDDNDIDTGDGWAPDAHDYSNDFTELISVHRWRGGVKATGVRESSTEEPIFQGSQFLMKDLCRFALFIKNSNAAIGDRLFASIVGAIALFLPVPNTFTSILQSNPSMFSTLKMINTVADIPDDLATFKMRTCAKGCLPLWKGLLNSALCPACKDVTWKHCRVGCVNATGIKTCAHPCQVVREFFYLSIRDRVKKLLSSDLHNLFHYEDYRHKSSNDSFVEDIYDSATYKYFKDIIPVGDRLIFLQVRDIA